MFQHNRTTAQSLYSEQANQWQYLVLRSLQNKDHSSDSFDAPTLMNGHQHDNHETNRNVCQALPYMENLYHLPTNQDSFHSADNPFLVWDNLQSFFVFCRRGADNPMILC